MKIMRMRRSGRRIALNERKARLFMRLGIAYEDQPIVVKDPVPQLPADSIFEGIMESAAEAGNESISTSEALEEEEEKPKRKRRRYKRRDMKAEKECA